MPLTFVSTSELPESALDILRAVGEVRVWPGQVPIPRDALLEGVADADALVCLLSERVDAEVLDAAKRLRVVSDVAVGFNNVDLTAAAARKIWVTNTPDVLTNATADLAMALILAAARRLGEAERFLRDGHWERWGFAQFWGMELNGRTLGILGFGRIGRAVARRAEAFGMVIRGVTSRAETDEIDRVIADADIVSIHVPLTADTHHMVDARRIALMRPTSILVNTSRGSVVDEEALVAALLEGRIAGAGLDVFEHEPSVHPGLLQAANAVLVPHIGSATSVARTAMAELAAHNAAEVLSGRRPPNAVAFVD